MEQENTRNNSFTLINNFDKKSKNCFQGANFLVQNHYEYNFSKSGVNKNQWLKYDNTPVSYKKENNNFGGSIIGEKQNKSFENNVVNSKKRKRHWKKKKRNNIDTGYVENTQQKSLESGAVNTKKYTNYKDNFNIFRNDTQSRKKSKPNSSLETIPITSVRNHSNTNSNGKNIKALHNYNVSYKQKKKRQKFINEKYNNGYRCNNATNKPKYNDQVISNGFKSNINEKPDSDLFYFDISGNRNGNSVSILAEKYVEDGLNYFEKIHKVNKNFNVINLGKTIINGNRANLLCNKLNEGTVQKQRLKSKIMSNEAAHSINKEFNKQTRLDKSVIDMSNRGIYLNSVNNPALFKKSKQVCGGISKEMENYKAILDEFNCDNSDSFKDEISVLGKTKKRKKNKYNISESINSSYLCDDRNHDLDQICDKKETPSEFDLKAEEIGIVSSEEGKDEESIYNKKRKKRKKYVTEVVTDLKDHDCELKLGIPIKKLKKSNSDYEQTECNSLNVLPKNNKISKSTKNKEETYNIQHEHQSKVKKKNSSTSTNSKIIDLTNSSIKIKQKHKRKKMENIVQKTDEESDELNVMDKSKFLKAKKKKSKYYQTERLKENFEEAQHKLENESDSSIVTSETKTSEILQDEESMLNSMKKKRKKKKPDLLMNNSGSEHEVTDFVTSNHKNKKIVFELEANNSPKRTRKKKIKKNDFQKIDLEITNSSNENALKLSKKNNSDEGSESEINIIDGLGKSKKKKQIASENNALDYIKNQEILESGPENCKFKDFKSEEYLYGIFECSNKNKLEAEGSVETKMEELNKKIENIFDGECEMTDFLDTSLTKKRKHSSVSSIGSDDHNDLSKAKKNKHFQIKKSVPNYSENQENFLEEINKQRKDNKKLDIINNKMFSGDLSSDNSEIITPKPKSIKHGKGSSKANENNTRNSKPMLELTENHNKYNNFNENESVALDLVDPCNSFKTKKKKLKHSGTEYSVLDYSENQEIFNKQNNCMGLNLVNSQDEILKSSHSSSMKKNNLGDRNEIAHETEDNTRRTNIISDDDEPSDSSEIVSSKWKFVKHNTCFTETLENNKSNSTNVAFELSENDGQFKHHVDDLKVEVEDQDYLDELDDESTENVNNIDNKSNPQTFSVSNSIFHKKRKKTSSKSIDVLEDEENDIKPWKNVEKSRSISVFAEYVQNKENIKSEDKSLIAEISTDPEEVDDDKEKLKNLDVVFPFAICRLHSLTTRTTTPTKELLEKIKEMNLTITSGPFSKEEDGKIIENWKRLCIEHDLRMNPSVFIKFPTRMRMETKINILRYIGHGLDDRPLHRIYIRFRHLLQKDHLITGRFTPSEDKTILEYMDKTKSMYPFKDLSKFLYRTSISVEKRYEILTSNDKVIHWTPELVDTFIKTLMKITKCEKIKKLKHREFTTKEWKKLSKKFANISIRKLQRAWKVTIYPRLFSKDVNLREMKENLIYILCDRGETDWKKVDWKEIAKHFKGFTPEKIYMMFKHLTYFHVPVDKRSDLTECLDFLKNKLLKYDRIPTTHKFKKFVVKDGHITYDT